jgi:hypothetical protein
MDAQNLSAGGRKDISLSIRKLAFGLKIPFYFP